MGRDDDGRSQADEAEGQAVKRLVIAGVFARLASPCAPNIRCPRAALTAGDVTDFRGVDMHRIPAHASLDTVSGVAR